MISQAAADSRHASSAATPETKHPIRNQSFMTNKYLTIAIAGCVAALASGVQPAGAQTQNPWTGPDEGDWHDSANWTSGVPNSSQAAIIGNTTTAVITQDTLLGRIFPGFDTGQRIGRRQT